MSSKIINNIFYITDGIEEYSESLGKNCEVFNFYSNSIENLYLEVEKVVNYSDREKNLIILKKENYTEEYEKIISNIFLSKLNIVEPHILFLDFKVDKNNVSISYEKDFNYEVSVDEINNKKLYLNKFSLNLIFTQMQNFRILHNYIIDSFKSIVDTRLSTKQKGKIEKLYKKLQFTSRIDSLTQVLTRNAFFEAMETERMRTIRNFNRLKELEEHSTDHDSEVFKDFCNKYGNFCCLIIDIDNFKKINDTFGHLAGDRVLSEFGRILMSKRIFRENDIIGRYGGEEFSVILPETNIKNAIIPSEKLRKEIKDMSFDYNNKMFNLTISMGISEFKINDNSCIDIINRADKALYYAKNNGKDQVVIFEELKN